MTTLRADLFSEDERHLIVEGLMILMAEIPLDETDLGNAEKLIKELEVD